MQAEHLDEQHLAVALAPTATPLAIIPQGDIGRHAIGGAHGAADSVRCQGYRVRGSDIDLFRDLDLVVHLEAKVAHSAFNLRMSK